MIQFIPELGYGDFRRKMKLLKLKQKYNAKVRNCTRFHFKVSNNQHKMLEKCFILWNFLLKIV
jgi:hypothetical protein